MYTNDINDNVVHSMIINFCHLNSQKYDCFIRIYKAKLEKFPQIITNTYTLCLHAFSYP